MTTISAATVNELRQRTGAGLMDCKEALTKSNGNMEEAVDYLRKKGQKISLKRSDKEAREGAVIAVTSEDGRTGVIVHLTSETDFVARNEDFVKFTRSLATLALDKKPKSIPELENLPLDGTAVKDRIHDMVGKIGEKIELKTYEIMTGEGVAPYIHAGNKIGVLVSLTKPAAGKVLETGRDVAMQIAAMSPIAVDAGDVPKEVTDKELEIARELAKAEGKPEQMLNKIAEGRLQKFFKENTLVNQQFVKDSSKTVGQVLMAVDPGLKVTAFRRIAVGE